MVTIKDVAKAASISLGSVSHYLNNQGARSLRRGQTQSVGLIIPDISNQFYAEPARVLEHHPWDAGFQTF